MLGFLLARTAIGEGHKVDIFLSGDDVELIRCTAIKNLVGFGTGSLKGKKVKKVFSKTLLDLVLSTDKTLIY